MLKNAKAVPTKRRVGASEERRYSSYSFTTSALDGVSDQRYSPYRGLAPGKRHSVAIVGGWMGPRVGLDTEARGKILSPLPGIEPQSAGRPAHSQTLYWLSYPADNVMCNWIKIHVWNKICFPLSIWYVHYLRSSAVASLQTRAGRTALCRSVLINCSELLSPLCLTLQASTYPVCPQQVV
jgi:hypothetical protein